MNELEFWIRTNCKNIQRKANKSLENDNVYYERLLSFVITFIVNSFINCLIIFGCLTHLWLTALNSTHSFRNYYSLVTFTNAIECMNSLTILNRPSYLFPSYWWKYLSVSTLKLAMSLLKSRKCLRPIKWCTKVDVAWQNFPYQLLDVDNWACERSGKRSGAGRKPTGAERNGERGSKNQAERERSGSGRSSERERRGERDSRKCQQDSKAAILH